MDFAPGDRVRVIAETSAACGRKGTVSKVFTMERHPDLKPSVHVDLDTVPEALKGAGIGPIGKTFVFPPKALEKVQGSRNKPRQNILYTSADITRLYAAPECLMYSLPDGGEILSTTYCL